MVLLASPADRRPVPSEAALQLPGGIQTAYSLPGGILASVAN